MDQMTMTEALASASQPDEQRLLPIGGTAWPRHDAIDHFLHPTG
ncbi:hypothetical protein ABID92_002771 [Frigoribacterium sp. PvP120]|nr:MULTISPECIES: hypothetical protein [Frigoribacterium]MBP1240727.1 hypothetical protein [Frigoribacterium sp. PvP121]NII49629.1 hypothetical protein [Frigoribacterium endophyticum]